MPRQIDADMTFDDIESEILFTRAALKADPDAEDLVAATEGWLGQVDEVRGLAREVRAEVAAIDAQRITANARLDTVCTTFGDELFLAVGKDRKGKRWLQFFKVPVSSFVRQALATQVATVRGWLEEGDDEVLEKHRAELQRWATAADDALVRTRGSAAQRRGQLWQRREELADALTRERDSLHEALSARARERDLPRNFANAFFRKSTRRRRSAADDEQPPVE
jgi:hypothetical protein